MFYALTRFLSFINNLFSCYWKKSFFFVVVKRSIFHCSRKFPSWPLRQTLSFKETLHAMLKKTFILAILVCIFSPLKALMHLPAPKMFVLNHSQLSLLRHSILFGPPKKWADVFLSWAFPPFPVLSGAALSLFWAFFTKFSPEFRAKIKPFQSAS